MGAVAVRCSTPAAAARDATQPGGLESSVPASQLHSVAPQQCSNHVKVRRCMAA